MKPRLRYTRGIVRHGFQTETAQTVLSGEFAASDFQVLVRHESCFAACCTVPGAEGPQLWSQVVLAIVQLGQLCSWIIWVISYSCWKGFASPWANPLISHLPKICHQTGWLRLYLFQGSNVLFLC